MRSQRRNDTPIEAHRRRRLRHQDGTGTDAAQQQQLAAAHADRRSMAEARPLLDRVVGRLDGDEEVLDMVAGLAAGHDGVLLVTNRRALFAAPRRTLVIPHDEITAVRIRDGTSERG